MTKGKSTKFEWCAYRHVDGSIHLKRYLGDPLDLREMRESPFVSAVTGPFHCNQREALGIATARLGPDIGTKGKQ